MARCRASLALLLLGVLGAAVVACGGGSGGGAPLPDGGALLRSSATEMRGVQSAHFTLAVDGTVAGVSVRSAQGVLTRNGDVQASGQIEELGQPVEIELVILGSTAYLKGPTGGFQRIATSAVAAGYDPSAVLDPKRGVGPLLAAARNPRTEAREEVGGRPAYRVAASFDQQSLATLLPGVTGQVAGQLWVGTDRPRLLQARFAVPAASGGQPGTVTVTLSRFDEPTTIRPPG
jgi:lipoprotein LprG